MGRILTARRNRSTLAAMVGTAVLLGACTTNPDAPGTDDLWRDYCATEGFQAEKNTRVTVQSWDPENTTAGHRGVSTDSVLEPDGANPPPRGC